MKAEVGFAKGGKEERRKGKATRVCLAGTLIKTGPQTVKYPSVFRLGDFDMVNCVLVVSACQTTRMR